MNEEKGKCNIVVMGDCSAVVGEGKGGKTAGQYELGTRNERGQRLVEFCERHKLVVTNTCFKVHKRRDTHGKDLEIEGDFKLNIL